MLQFFANFTPANDDHPFWRWLLDRKVGDPTPPRFRAFGDNLRNFAVAGFVLKGAQVVLAGKPNWPEWFVGHLVGGVGHAFVSLCALQVYGLCDMVFVDAMKGMRMSGWKRKSLRWALIVLNAIVPVFFVIGMNTIVGH